MMAIRSASRWWASVVFGVGMLLVIVGRLFDSGTGAQLVLASVGGVLLLAMTAVRLVTMIRADKTERGFERALLFLQLFVLAGLAFDVVSDANRDARVGLARHEYDSHHSASVKWRTRGDAAMVVLWGAAIAASFFDRKDRRGPPPQP